MSAAADRADPLPDPLDPVWLQARLAEGAGWAGHATVLQVVPQTGSTNADLAEQARAGAPEGLVLAAEHQSAGRGRLDRQWQAPAGAGLTVSVLLRPPAPMSTWSWLALIGALAVAEGIEAAGSLPAVLKWPNDVLVEQVAPGLRPGKIAGLLGEVVPTAEGPALVLGLGVNVHQSGQQLPVPQATSVRAAGGACTRGQLLVAVLLRLQEWYRLWVQHGAHAPADGPSLADRYRHRCGTIGRQIQVQVPQAPGLAQPADGAALLTGTAQGVDDEGRLLLATEGGPARALSVGDVVHVRQQ